jgi:GT2 family glycosyltransferase
VYASVDADSVIHADWLPRIVKVFSEDPSLLCISGPYLFYGLPPWQERLTVAWWSLAQYQKATVVGGNFAARREALEKIGGFNTEIAFWSEDAYVARKLSELGRIKFALDFYNFTSARRLQGQGFVTVGAYYAINYFSQMYFKKPFMTGNGERTWETKPTRVPMSTAVRKLPTAALARAKRYARSHVRAGAARD